ncbi:hypothetical protein BJ508DRAFT_340172 [Ascobolus immersus RN42]|uniref:Uncharacterized protein n=1 Tax=Ascobolus immersus RN42 TaxID=1160509 RepID=A0A3N4HKP6_ASCIM|nr:hypothetical protein BJ508DRAFT_340172 [Ascobolus immersus RN42]
MRGFPRIQTPLAPDLTRHASFYTDSTDGESSQDSSESGPGDEYALAAEDQTPRGGTESDRWIVSKLREDRKLPGDRNHGLTVFGLMQHLQNIQFKQIRSLLGTSQDLRVSGDPGECARPELDLAVYFRDLINDETKLSQSTVDSKPVLQHSKQMLHTIYSKFSVLLKFSTVLLKFWEDPGPSQDGDSLWYILRYYAGRDSNGKKTSDEDNWKFAKHFRTKLQVLKTFFDWFQTDPVLGYCFEADPTEHCDDCVEIGSNALIELCENEERWNSWLSTTSATEAARPPSPAVSDASEAFGGSNADMCFGSDSGQDNVDQAPQDVCQDGPET